MNWLLESYVPPLTPGWNQRSEPDLPIVAVEGTPEFLRFRQWLGCSGCSARDLAVRNRPI